jgi:hypothetical protein
MSTIKRIDPTTVPTIFERFGLQPTQNSWVDHKAEPCGMCLLVALAAEQLGLEKALELGRAAYFLCEWTEEFGEVLESVYVDDIEYWSDILIFADAMGLNERYACGLRMGWDGEQFRSSYGGASEAGYHDGKAAWEAVQQANREREQ